MDATPPATATRQRDTPLQLLGLAVILIGGSLLIALGEALGRYSFFGLHPWDVGIPFGTYLLAASPWIIFAPITYWMDRRFFETQRARMTPNQKRVQKLAVRIIGPLITIASYVLFLPRGPHSTWPAIAWTAGSLIVILAFLFMVPELPIRYRHRALMFTVGLITFALVKVGMGYQRSAEFVKHATNDVTIIPAPGVTLDLPANGASLYRKGTKAWLFVQHLPGQTPNYRTYLYSLDSVAKIHPGL